MAEKRRRLGRGLDSLLPSVGEAPPEEAGAPQGGVREVPLREIELNPRQPRGVPDPEGLEGLADSIRASGVVQPVLVRPRGAGYELVVGERRLRACKMAGLETVPALVRDVPDEQMLELALVENVQRADLNPIERARAIRALMDDLGLTQEEVGKRIGFQRSTIANALRLLDLSTELQEMVSRGTLSAGHARAVLSVPGEGGRLRLARAVVSRGLSVRQAERLAAREAQAGPRRRYEPTPHLACMEEALSLSLDARVEIRQKRKGGKLVVHFADNDHFERLYETLTGHDTAEFDQ